MANKLAFYLPHKQVSWTLLLLFQLTVTNIHNFDSETQLVVICNAQIGTINQLSDHHELENHDLRSSLYAESCMHINPICPISLDRRNGVETIYFPNFRYGSKISWPKSNEKSNIYRLTHSASELSGFTCTSSLTMNGKFYWKFPVHC